MTSPINSDAAAEAAPPQPQFNEPRHWRSRGGGRGRGRGRGRARGRSFAPLTNNMSPNPAAADAADTDAVTAAAAAAAAADAARSVSPHRSMSPRRGHQNHTSGPNSNQQYNSQPYHNQRRRPNSSRWRGGSSSPHPPQRQPNRHPQQRQSQHQQSQQQQRPSYNNHHHHHNHHNHHHSNNSHNMNRIRHASPSPSPRPHSHSQSRSRSRSKQRFRGARSPPPPQSSSVRPHSPPPPPPPGVDLLPSPPCHPQKQPSAFDSLAHSSVGVPASDWSAKVWQGVGFSSGTKGGYGHSATGVGSDQTSAITVGLGRAIGLSRVPDQLLVNQPSLIEARLNDLLKRVEQLELFDCSVVSSKPDVSVDAAVSGETAAIFEAILADFRELTMAVTAASSTSLSSPTTSSTSTPICLPPASPSPVDALAIPVYEAAADAALLGGNLDFYLVCQTRLLHDLYPPVKLEAAAKRRAEFVGYSLLYFGVFASDGLEIARRFRSLDRHCMASPFVRYAIDAVNAFRSLNAVRFIAMYKRGNVRQRTILHPALKGAQKLGLRTIIKANLALNKGFAIRLLGMTSDDEFLRMLETQRPDLLPLNNTIAARATQDFVFRPPRTAAAPAGIPTPAMSLAAK